ncbi:hypothetical protein [Gordonia sihwensis]|uniref:hypothetical protein n=1 Tax=Gordonia sihwensis TaxID=173559 RepID=UPI003D986BAA
MFYVENGTFLRFYPTAHRDEALAQAALELGQEPELRAYNNDDAVPVIYHALGYTVVSTPLPKVYGLVDEAIDSQWWGPDEPGVTLLTASTELISVVFGTPERAQEIADDMQQTLTTVPYF